MTCAFPGCGLPARLRGHCEAHNRQRLRGHPLKPLRGQAPALERVSLRVPAPVSVAVRADPPGARSALERWSRSR